MDRYRRFVMTTKTKTKARSRIFEAVHETAGDLHRLGFIDKRKMSRFDALCLEPVPEYDSQRIRALRDHLQLSQAVLAAVLKLTRIADARKLRAPYMRRSAMSTAKKAANLTVRADLLEEASARKINLSQTLETRSPLS
jgi:putative transcriptional regulator